MIQLQQDEEVLWRSHTHPMILILRLAGGLLVALAIGSAAYMGFNFVGHSPLSSKVGIAVFIVVLIPVVTVVYLRWRNTIYGVTNFRLMRSEGVIGKKVMAISIERVQDVTYTLSIPGRFLNFGTVTVESAAASGRISLEYVPNPVDAAHQISAAARTARVSQVTRCARCGKNLDATWNLCPFCGNEISPFDPNVGKLPIQ